jgi:AraC family transcriptional regulator
MLAYFAHGKRHITERVPSKLRPNWEFFAVMGGRCAPVFGEDDWPELRENTLWVFAPDCRHGWIADFKRPIVRLCAHFGSVPHPLDTFVREHGNCYAKALTAAEILRLQAIAADLEPHYRRPTVLSPLYFTGRLSDLALIALTGGQAEQQQTLSNAATVRVENALAWYAKHLAKSPSVTEVAAAVHVSPSHLRRLFWEVQQSSPRAIFQKTRLQKAQELMNGSTDTLEEIASSCGFTDASHLCREYKKHYKVTPTLWRRHKVISFYDYQNKSRTK